MRVDSGRHYGGDYLLCFVFGKSRHTTTIDAFCPLGFPIMLAVLTSTESTSQFFLILAFLELVIILEAVSTGV